MTDLLDTLRAQRLVAIVRGPDPDAAVATVAALVEEGVTTLEVSLNTTDAISVLARARNELGAAALLGAGTVLTADDAARCADVGVDFVVTPGLGAGVDATLSFGLPVLAGAYTPSEVIAATAAGATAVKLFPASAGGAAYLRALRDPFPHVPFVPVGGVDAAAARDYLAIGAIAVGVGSPLVGDAAGGGSIDALRERVRDFVTGVRA